MRVLNADQETFAMTGDVKSDSHNVVRFFFKKKALDRRRSVCFSRIKRLPHRSNLEGKSGGLDGMPRACWDHPETLKPSFGTPPIRSHNNHEKPCWVWRLIREHSFVPPEGGRMRNGSFPNPSSRRGAVGFQQRNRGGNQS
jgi:hypothetical protein